VTGAYDGSIRVYKYYSNKYKLAQTLSDHKESVRSVVLSSDKKTILSASYDGTVKVWNLDTDYEDKNKNINEDNKDIFKKKNKSFEENISSRESEKI